MKKSFITCLLTILSVAASAQYHQTRTIAIWDNSVAPHSNEITDDEQEKRPYRLYNVAKAELLAYDADPRKQTGQAVIICPGGGYGFVSMDNEGFLPAQWLAENGIAAYVLKYRLPNGHPEVPLEDAVEALRIVRAEAAERGIDPTKVGIAGFSAGGHLAAYVSNFTSEADRPNFAVLFYPVITANNFSTHSGTFANLLGPNRTEKQCDTYSMEKCVTENTPPTLLLLSDDDRTVPSAGAALYYVALKYNGVKAAMAVFPSGGHGWGNYDSCPYREEWHNMMLRWLAELK